MKKNKNIYVVVAYRRGSRSAHSYLVGAFTRKRKAQSVAKNHVYYRGGKYAVCVERVPVDLGTGDQRGDILDQVIIVHREDAHKGFDEFDIQTAVDA